MIKSIYVSGYIMAGMGGFLSALVMMIQEGWQSAWLGTAIACGACALFFSKIILMPQARTSPNMIWMIAAGVGGTAISLYFSAGAYTTMPVVLSALVGILGSVAYIFWYSRFGAASNAVLTEGAQLPEFELRENGKTIKCSELTAKPALWIFFRGNWCPLCMAQIKEIAAQYRELARRGVEVYLVSPQSEANSLALSRKMDAPMRFMTDADNRVAEKLGILIKGGLPAGFQALGYDSDVPRPAVFISTAGGKLIHVDLTDNYRVRPEPSSFFSVLDRHAIV